MKSKGHIVTKPDKVRPCQNGTNPLNKMNCIFCDKEKQRPAIFCENDLFFARWDDFPVSQGHALIVPKRHIVSLFELTSDELTPLFELLKQTKDIISTKYKPDGYNIGANEGGAAGQTVHHLHLHLIPRYAGDVPNPRGGVRNIIPGKGEY